MNLRKVKKELFSSAHFKESQWAGGTTTQLYISPLVANYAERNFDFRISSATVNVETSTFTSLPGVQRKLMVLEGEMTVFHKDHYQTHLRPFDQDVFPGDWETTSAGKCTDFNVMTRGNWKSEMAAIHLQTPKNKVVHIKPWCSKIVLYAFFGSVEVQVKDEKLEVPNQHLLVADNWENNRFQFSSMEKSTVILVQLGQRNG